MTPLAMEPTQCLDPSSTSCSLCLLGQRIREEVCVLQDMFQIAFTTNRIACLQTTIYNTPIPMKSEVAYLGLHLDQRLTWQAHTNAKRQLNLRVKKILLAYRPNLPTVSGKQTAAV